jgi:hypothetical protein
MLERVEEPIQLDEDARVLLLKQHSDDKPAVTSPDVTVFYPDEPGLNMAGLMGELGIATLQNTWVEDKWHSELAVEDATAHFDPDLESRGRSAEWRPMLGQAGVAQSHLENQGVGKSDLFLFFGRFRKATRAGGIFGGNGPATWVKGAPSFHTLWGWLEVERLIDVNKGGPAPTWAAAHPHFMHAKLWTKTKNVVYVAREHLSFEPSLPGGGVFSRFRPAFQLTSASGKTVTDWELPAAFHPKNAGSLSYHTKPKRWSEPSGGRVRLQTVGRGQEFVIDVTPGIQEWIARLFQEETWNRAHRFTETDEFPIHWVSIGGVPVRSLEGTDQRPRRRRTP